MVREVPESRQGTTGDVRGDSEMSRDFPEARGSLTPSQRRAETVSTSSENEGALKGTNLRGQTESKRRFSHR